MPSNDENYAVNLYMAEEEVAQFAEDWAYNDESKFPVWPTQMEMRRFMDSVAYHMSYFIERT